MEKKGDGKLTFLEFLLHNENRINKQIDKLDTVDGQRGFFQESVFLLWQVYQESEETRDLVSTYPDFIFGQALFRTKRYYASYTKRQGIFAVGINPMSNQDNVTPEFVVLTETTVSKWKWIYYHIIFKNDDDFNSCRIIM